MPEDARPGHLKSLANAASWSLAKLLLEHVPKARASVYSFEMDGSNLLVFGYGGRGERPGDFVAGTPWADAAIDRVKNGKSLIVGDWDKDPPVGSTRKPLDWSSCVSVPIVSGDGYAYGMISVDAPATDSFFDSERHIVTVVAEVLAGAFAMAYPAAMRGIDANVSAEGKIEL